MNLLCVFTVVLLATPSLLRAAAPTPPNIIFMMADDHGRQAASCYGSKLIQTP